MSEFFFDAPMQPPPRLTRDPIWSNPTIGTMIRRCSVRVEGTEDECNLIKGLLTPWGFQISGLKPHFDDPAVFRLYLTISGRVLHNMVGTTKELKFGSQGNPQP